jgi:hypothetical protein
VVARLGHKVLLNSWFIASRELIISPKISQRSIANHDPSLGSVPGDCFAPLAYSKKRSNNRTTMASGGGSIFRT